MKKTGKYIDCSAYINATRVYGTITLGTDLAYKGDVEQCDDCGQDSFSVIVKEHSLGLASFTGHALKCDKCGTTYDLRCEE